MPGSSRLGRPRLALTWPVMPVMSATFLGLPISPSPEPLALGQRAGACAISPRGVQQRAGRSDSERSRGSSARRRGSVTRVHVASPGGREERAARAAPQSDRELGGGWERQGAGPAARRRGGVAAARRAWRHPVSPRRSAAPAAGPAPRQRPCGRGGAPEGGACRWALRPLAVGEPAASGQEVILVRLLAWPWARERVGLAINISSVTISPSVQPPRPLLLRLNLPGILMRTRGCGEKL